MNKEKLFENLIKNNMKPFFVETKEDALELVESLLKDKETVSHGGSETLKECGIIDLLNNGSYDYIDRSKATAENVREYYLKALGADSYITSFNAVTENGELYNVDGNSNRVAAIVYGPLQVIGIIGVNKIVKDLDEAVNRVKTIAAPKNAVRLNCDTYCKNTGHCLSVNNDYLCDGCNSEGRICRNYVISAKQQNKDRIKVIIVNENLGY